MRQQHGSYCRSLSVRSLIRSIVPLIALCECVNGTIQAAGGVASRGLPGDPQVSESVSLSQLAEIRGMEKALKTLVDATRCEIGTCFFGVFFLSFSHVLLAASLFVFSFLCVYGLVDCC